MIHLIKFKYLLPIVHTIIIIIIIITKRKIFLYTIILYQSYETQFLYYVENNSNTIV